MKYQSQKINVADLSLLPFLFPGYRYVSKPVFVSANPNAVIDMTQPAVRDRQPLDVFERYVLLVSAVHADVQIVTPHEIVKAISELRGIRFSKDVASKAERLSKQDEQLFMDFVKMSVASKRWMREYLEANIKAYELFGAMLDTRNKFLQAYYEMRKLSPPEVIFASILTFIQRAQTYEEQRESLGSYYRMMVKKARNFLPNVKKAMGVLLQVPSDVPNELKYIQFYLSVRGNM